MNKENKIVYSREERQLLEQIIGVDKTNRQEFDRQYEEVQENLKKCVVKKRWGMYTQTHTIFHKKKAYFLTRDKGGSPWRSYALV
ncbi:MAG: hypothetical protein RSG75_06510 [Cellulosilyticaceae bacterium]